MPIWTDTFRDFTKIDSYGRVALEISSSSTLIRGDPLVGKCLMESGVEVTNFFNDFAVPGTSSWSTVSTQPGAGGEKCLRMNTQPGDIFRIGKWYKSGAHFVGGWRQSFARIWLYVDGNVISNGVDTRFMMKFIPEGQQGLSSQVSYEFGIRVDVDVNANYFLVTRSCDSSGNMLWANSGAAIPQAENENKWVKLDISYESDKITYYIDGNEVTGYQPDLADMASSVHVYIRVDNGDTVAHSVYWDNFYLFSAIEHNDDSSVYPDHNHSFTTDDIGSATGNAGWGSIKVTPKYTYPEDDVKILWSVYSVTDDLTITGLVNRAENFADIKNVIDARDDPQIYIKVKFYDTRPLYDYILRFLDKKNSRTQTWSLRQLDVDYEGTDDRLSISCVANEYNDDLVEPIDTKTGYLIRIKIAALDYYYNREKTEDDDYIYVAYYWIDFGDGTNSGWVTTNEVNHIYTKHSQNTSESGADKEWNARARVMWSSGDISEWSQYLDFNVLNAAPVASIITRPKRVRMSGAGVATIKFYGDESFDTDDNGMIWPSGGYMFDFGKGDSPYWQESPYAEITYSGSGLYEVGLTVRDDFFVESTKVVTKIRILPILTATLLSFNHRPREVADSRSYEYDIYHTIDDTKIYPSVEPGNRANRTLKVAGQSHNSEDDIVMLHSLAESHTPVALQYYKIDGSLTTFVGYILSIDASRKGGLRWDVPWDMTLQYLEGLEPGEETMVGLMKYDEGTSLPTASESYVNTYFRVTGGTGVDDVGYLCVKNTMDEYVWVKIVEGGTPV